MQHGKKDRPFDVETMESAAPQLSKDLGDPKFLPEPFEDECRTDLSGFSRHLAFSRKRVRNVS
jgi:hypothetical protein